MVKCESLRIKYVPNNNHKEKSVNFRVTHVLKLFCYTT